MTSIRDRASPLALVPVALVLVALLALALGGCGLAPHPPPPPFDCAQIDRAEERFPMACGDAGEDIDAGVEDAAP